MPITKTEKQSKGATKPSQAERNSNNQIKSTRKTLFQKSFIVLCLIMKGFAVCILPSRKRNSKRNQLVPSNFNIVAFDTVDNLEMYNIFDAYTTAFMNQFKNEETQIESSTIGSKVTNVNSLRQIAKKAADFKIMQSILDFLKTENIQLEYSFRKKEKGIGSTPRIKEVYFNENQRIRMIQFFTMYYAQDVACQLLNGYLNEDNIDSLGECFYHMIIEKILDSSSRSNNPEIQTIYPYWENGSTF